MSAMTKIVSKKILYRHSSSFYRKVKNTLQEKRKHLKVSEQENIAVNEHINDKHKNDCDEVSDNVFYDSVGDTSDSERETCSVKIIPFKENLRNWAIKHNISHLSLNDLLKILKEIGIDLPKDSRSLLDTPRFINIVPMGKGSYWYYGIINNLKHIFQEVKPPESIGLIFNIDGLPPFRSSNIELWPILFMIDEMRNIKPMVVAIYCGTGKPVLQPYLSCFVEELKNILRDGVSVNGHIINIRIKFFVCDTPARSFIKGMSIFITPISLLTFIIFQEQ